MSKAFSNSSKILEKIEPYNDIWYKNCFYASLFPVIHYLDQSINPILFNDAFVYKYEKYDNSFNFELANMVIQPFSDCLVSIGINMDVKHASNCIMEDLISSIDKGRPVIVFIDCYYLPIRPESYLKTHYTTPHAFLVYGYNNNLRQFNILEHDYYDSYFYVKRIINYDDLINSYNSCLSYFSDFFKKHEFIICKKDGIIPTYYEFSKTLNRQTMKSSYNSDYMMKFIEYLNKNEKLLFDGVESIKLFVDSLENIILDETQVHYDIDNLISLFNNILVNKKSDRSRIIRVLGTNETLLRLTDEILNILSHSTSILAKFKFSGLYKYEHFNVMIKKIRMLYSFEYKYHEVFIDYLKKWSDNKNG